MASSFSNQIPCIINLLVKLNPGKVLDIGKGFGKYGFLLHEYVGIDNKKRLNPLSTLVEQSRIHIDALEVDTDLLLPHLPQIYNNVFVGDIFELYQELGNYDLVLMIDVIEHLDKEKAIQLLKQFVSAGTVLIIATPKEYFQQELYESEFEHHVSHWTKDDFEKIGNVDYQYMDGGAVYVLANKKIDIRGFGHSLMKKFRRVARAIKNEFA